MVYIFILIYLIIIPITMLYMLLKILEKVSNYSENLNNNNNLLAKRKHTNIVPNNYNNSLTTREEYKDYKNSKGLFEPIIKPHKPGKNIKED